MPTNEVVKHDGAKLRKARLEAGFTQAQLAKRAKCAADYISGLETMTNHDHVGAPLYGRLCRALGKKWVDLLRDEDVA